MKRKSLLVLLLSVMMVLSPALCAFADSEATDNAGEGQQQEVVVDLTEEEDAPETIEDPVAEEKAIEEADKASEEQPVMRGEPKDSGCSHINKDTYVDWNSDEVQIEEIEGDDCYHRVIGDIYIVTYCEDCGEDLKWTPYGDNEILASHDYGSNHVCTLCGHVNGCKHKKTYVWYDYDEVEITDDENGDTHSVTGYITRKTTCKYCEEDLETENLGYTTVHEEHDYVSGVCDLCGHKRNENWANNGTYYYDANGKLAKGWKKIDGEWYYFDKSSGVKKTGWLKDGSYWYYLDPAVSEISGVSGAMAIGWKKISKKMYYFDSSGKMKTGWLKLTHTDEDGETYTDWYYLNSSGAQLFGWQKISNKWYYFEENYFEDDYDEDDYDAGYMATGIWYVDNVEKAYLFGSKGGWQSGFTGWKSETVIFGDGDKYTYWYYFKKGVGVNGWQKISNTWYCFEDGYMLADTWASDSSGEYWLGSNGKITKNKWIKDYNGNWRYMGSNGHPVCNKWIKDSKGWCYLDENGIMVTNG